MTLIKIELHKDTLLYNTVTEMNRILGTDPDAMLEARKQAEELSRKFSTRQGFNAFVIITVWNDRLGEWI